jgi:hypothetical protein
MERIIKTCNMGRSQLKNPIAYSKGKYNGPIWETNLESPDERE